MECRHRPQFSRRPLCQTGVLEGHNVIGRDGCRVVVLQIGSQPIKGALVALVGRPCPAAGFSLFPPSIHQPLQAHRGGSRWGRDGLGGGRLDLKCRKAAGNGVRGIIASRVLLARSHCIPQCPHEGIKDHLAGLWVKRVETLPAEQPVHERSASLLQVNRWGTRQLALRGLVPFAVAKCSSDGGVPSARLIVHQIGGGEGHPPAFLIGDPDVLPPL